MGFTQSTSDPCIFHMDAGGDIFYLGVYIDDIVLAGRIDSRIQEVKAALSRKWVIPYQFTEVSHMTLSELDKIWWVGSLNGHM